MATTQEYRDAARKLPKDRTPREQQLVDRGKRAGMQDVRNADFNAHERQRKFG